MLILISYLKNNIRMVKKIQLICDRILPYDSANTYSFVSWEDRTEWKLELKRISRLSDFSNMLDIKEGK